MLKNYFKIAWRNLNKQKLYSFINVGGLSIGLACTILILLWVYDELSFDRFHENADTLYRMNWDFKYSNMEGVGPGTPPPLAAVMAKEIPDVVSATRVYPVSKMVVRNGDKFFNEGKIFAADANFLEMFNFTLLSGNPKSSLAEPNSVLLTEETARKYFGDAPALGKALILGDHEKNMYGTYQNLFKVTGVLKNLPRNSHIQFDLLTSMSSYPQIAWRDWSWVWMQVTTYVRLRPSASVSLVEAQVQEAVKRHLSVSKRGISYDQIVKNHWRWNFVFQPLTDIYLGSANSGNRLGPIGNRTYVYVFSIVALFILLIACINFMNLATARSAGRAREVGLRKVLGSRKRMLIGQFLVESVVFSFIAMIIALFIVEIFIRPFNFLAGKSLTFNLLDPAWLPAALTLLALFVGLVSGSYPGFYLSSFMPAHVLRGTFRPAGKSLRLRNILVVLQFTITIALIACTLLVRQQMNFVLQADLGFNKEDVLIVSNENNRLGSRVNAFRDRLKNQPGVMDASVSTGAPPDQGFQDSYAVEGKGAEQMDLMSYLVDENFLTTLDIKIVQGRGFSKEYSDSANVILNEAAVKQIGWTEPIGKTITYGGSSLGPLTYTVIGVAKDFNFMTLYTPIMPFALFHTSSKSYSVSSSSVVARIRHEDLESSLRNFEAEWRSFAPEMPFEYSFLDQNFEENYLSEKRLGNIFLIFSFLTIFIACVGLFALAAFATEQRTKEIGIRKVLGASVTGVTGLLSREFVYLVLWANLFAWPMAYYGIRYWLEDFAYRIEIGLGAFFAAGIAAVMIALLTVSYQAVKAATANPVDALKYE